MNTPTTLTAAVQMYARAHAAHYTEDDLLGALQGYGKVIASHPDSPEAKYSRTQILALVNRVVPVEELLASHTDLVRRRLRPESDRPVAKARS